MSAKEESVWRFLAALLLLITVPVYGSIPPLPAAPDARSILISEELQDLPASTHQSPVFAWAVCIVIQSYSYGLGPAGNRERIDEHDGTARVYGYDALYRLTTETVSQAGATVYANVFHYDPVGNREAQDRTDDAGATTTVSYDYDDRDRLTAEDANPHTWDTNGNLTAKTGEATYVWGYENRLTAVNLADGTVVLHTYDADGVRVRTEVTPQGGVVEVTDYLVDTSGALSQVVAEVDGAGNLTSHYVRGDDLLAVVRPATGARYYHADGLGSIRALTGDAETVTDRYSFEAFGELLAHVGDDPNGYLFAGEALDPNSGFYYLRARWMDPGTGRFAGMDPFKGFSTEPLTLHRYLYANGDPAGRIDPSGYFSVAEAATVLVMVGLVALAVSTAILNATGLRPFNTIRVTIDPVIVDRTWDDAEVLQHLIDARYVFQKFGIALNWSPIDKLEYRAAPSSEPYTRRDFGRLAYQELDRGKRAVVAFVGEPFIDDGIYRPGLSVHIDYHGPYFGLLSHSHVEHTKWTSHELAHVLGALRDLWGIGNLMERPWPGDKLDDNQVKKLREHARHLR